RGARLRLAGSVQDPEGDRDRGRVPEACHRQGGEAGAPGRRAASRPGVLELGMWVFPLAAAVIAAAFSAMLALRAVRRRGPVHRRALSATLPLGRDVFGAGSTTHGLPQSYSIPAFAVLVVLAAWSVWRMRTRPELRPRSVGVAGVAVGAMITAIGSGFGAGF